ncbi:DUF7601 domain-containing protein [Paenibacillus woosongensis]|uniref:Uncharacterized protein n=1 Tax=Paenibacillus woosongensis TaxID=307580 RepID=A0ABQ4MMH0_9BACL|nr:carboxypeptidase regulatory-like domain-containing protein [Paenibacillus woosongensis]GIP57176.1 hypothetical protein J15TS10_09900 [Paenibacillus woosongensis]
MKRRRSVSKSVLSFCLAVMLILQTFSAPAYAESVLSNSGPATVSVDGSPSVTDAVYDEPVGLQPAFPMALMAGPADKTAMFMGVNDPFPLEVVQNNQTVDPNGTIQGRQQFTLKSEGLKVPVNGDDADPTNANPDLYIQKGDWIELKRDDYFEEVVLPTATKTLMASTEFGQKQLGIAYFTPDSIKIVFNGDESFFNGVGRAVTFGFETTANSDVAGLVYGESKPISIFGGAYQLKNPDVTPAYSITLASPGMIRWDQYGYRGIQHEQFVEGAITWQSTVSAFDKFDTAIKLPLDGMKFFTDPASYNTSNGNVRGIYMPGSFKVNDIAVNPDIDIDGKLSYIFPTGTGLDPKVEFKTWIPKEAYYYEYKNPPGNLGRSHRDMNGIVRLKQSDDTVLVSAGQEISFAPDWIQTAGSLDHENQIITWTTDVNSKYNKKGLKNFTITDVLPTGLEFMSATYQTWEDGITSGSKSITPDANGVYSFGDINGRVQLVIKSKIISGDDFTNVPRANWDLETKDANGNALQNNDVKTGNRPNAVTDEARIIVGAHTFTKAGSISMADYNLGSITWTVNLTPQYALPNAVVYDVLVHGGDLNVLDNAVDETGEVSAETIAKIKAKVNSAQLWKKYQNGTLKGVTNAAGLDMKAIPLTVNGEVVADLIKVTGYSTDKATSFSFRALETNLDVLFRQDINAGKTRWNRALLFDGENVKQAENQINLHLRMLNKDMLTASYPIKKDGTADTWYTPNDVGRYIGYDSTSSGDEYTLAGYDRTTKAVTFRLGVNMPGYNTVEMARDGGNRVITNVKLVDTLPEGWEFVPFANGKDYELYKGYSDNGSGTGYGVRNNAGSIIEPNDPAHVVSFSHSGNVGTFTFSELEGPYVILVKARPSNAALEKYLEEYTTIGTDRQVLYNKADLHMTWGGAEKVVTEQRKVIVPIQTLDKSVTKPVPGVLEWTVNYTPPFNMKQGVYLQDTLGAGMNLRYDVNGKLVLTAPSMAVYPAKMTASGALERDGAALDLSDPNAEVQVEAAPGSGGTTVLKFKMDDPNKFYQFVYQSEVDPSKTKAGDKMGNEVKLIGDDKLKSVSARSESTLDSSDVAGSSSSNAQLPLKKVDPDGNPLQGVQFTLYKKSNGTEATKGTTDSGGKLNLLFPDPGYYELKETYIDTNTWLPITHVYQVYVGNTPGKPIWVDGIKVDTNNPLVVPTPAQGKLTISNEVKGNGSDSSKDFEYTVTFTGEGQDGEYTYKKPDNTFGRIKSGGKITLKHGESVTLPALPKDLVYSVTEADYTTLDGYTTIPETRELFGTIENKGDHRADFINERYVNDLTVSNTVSGDGAEPDKPFKYTVTFDGTGKGQEYDYEHSDGTTGKIKSGDTFELKHDETFKIKDLPENLKYTILQEGYKNDGYATIPVELSDEGVMARADREADFTNERTVNKLTISNTVMGNGGDQTKEFEYTVTFDGTGKDGSYSYEKSDGDKGTIKSGGTFTLKHGEALEILGLPKDLKYTVTQKDYTADEYVTTIPDKHTGVMEGKDEEAPFTNVRVLEGGLIISNMVKGKDDDKRKLFKYTVTFTGEGANESYSYEKSDGSKGMIMSGDTFELTDGQTFVVQGLPTYLEYTVTQDDYTKGGYVTDPEGLVRTGAIPEKQLAEAHFVNTRPYLEGVLRDNNTGQEIPNAKIIVTNKKTNEQQTIWTNDKGEYSIPAQADTDYTITYTKLYQVGGTDVPVEFTQKANVDISVTDQTVPADITAVGIVIIKQLDGTTELFNDSFTSNMYIYLKDKDGNYIKENGHPKAFPMASNGTFSVEGLSEQKYTMEVRYKAETGEELLFKVTQLNVKANGELNISEELVDPYGTVYDESTGDAITGKKIDGAKVTLYYADTQRNRDNGRIPDTKVTLPPVPNFPPHDNESPEQDSDANGFYAYMVFPEADYYLIVTKDGYETHRSDTISVDFDIVRYDVPMKPIRSGGGSGGGSGNGNSGTGNGNSEADNGNSEADNGYSEADNSNSEADNGYSEADNGYSEADNGNTEADNGNSEADNGNSEANNGNSEADNGNSKVGNANDELDDVPKTEDNSTSPFFYMALALMSLMVIAFCLSSSKKKKHIQ